MGTSPGNSQDQMTRLVAWYLPKYIAGNPSIMVENPAGASSVIAADYLFKSLRTMVCIGVVSRALYFDQLVGRQEVQFDCTKFTWVGSPVEGNDLILVAGTTPYKTLRDVVNSGDAVKCGASGSTSTGYYVPSL